MRTQFEHSAIPKPAPPCPLVPFFLLNWAGPSTVRWLTTQPHRGWNQVIHSQANKAGHQYRNLWGPFPLAVTKHRVLTPKGLVTSWYYKQHFLSVCYDFKVCKQTNKNLLKFSRYNWNISSQAEVLTLQTTTRELILTDHLSPVTTPHPNTYTILNRRKQKHWKPDAWLGSPEGKGAGIGSCLHASLLLLTKNYTYIWDSSLKTEYTKRTV